MYQLAQRLRVGETRCHPRACKLANKRYRHEADFHGDDLPDRVAAIGGLGEISGFGGIDALELGGGIKSRDSDQLQLGLLHIWDQGEVAIDEVGGRVEGIALKSELSTHFHHPIEQDHPHAPGQMFLGLFEIVWVGHASLLAHHKMRQGVETQYLRQFRVPGTLRLQLQVRVARLLPHQRVLPRPRHRRSITRTRTRGRRTAVAAQALTALEEPQRVLALQPALRPRLLVGGDVAGFVGFL